MKRLLTSFIAGDTLGAVGMARRATAASAGRASPRRVVS